MSLEHSPARARAGGNVSRTKTKADSALERAQRNDEALERARRNPLALTVSEFCASHRISRSQLYKLWRQSRGPRCMEVGKRRLISVEAAAAWRREREENV
jgi:hypothetical protein